MQPANNEYARLPARLGIDHPGSPDSRRCAHGSPDACYSRPAAKRAAAVAVIPSTHSAVTEVAAINAAVSFTTNKRQIHAGAHRPRLQAARLHAPDATQRGGASAAQSAGRRPRLVTRWSQNGRNGVRTARAGRRL